MELVTDSQGRAAPGLGEVELTAEQARAQHDFLIHQVQRMLCAGLIHGDLSEYNVLVGTDGPVIIDLPQVVNAAGNNSARAMLLRDVNNLTATLSRFAPDLAATRYGEELWQLYELGELHIDSVLSGRFVDDDAPVDIEVVQHLIDDALDEQARRQRGRAVAKGSAEHVDVDPHPEQR